MEMREAAAIPPRTGQVSEVRSGREGPAESGERPGTPCVVCLKPLGGEERRWTVHFRGSERVVCCPSCAREFNRAPRQYVEAP